MKEQHDYVADLEEQVKHLVEASSKSLGFPLVFGGFAIEKAYGGVGVLLRESRGGGFKGLVRIGRGDVEEVLPGPVKFWGETIRVSLDGGANDRSGRLYVKNDYIVAESRGQRPIFWAAGEGYPTFNDGEGGMGEARYHPSDDLGECVEADTVERALGVRKYDTYEVRRANAGVQVTARILTTELAAQRRN